MTTRAPTVTFTLLFMAAVCVLTGGVILARRTETVRETRDREPLRVFSATLGGEVDRLERHYESHLRRIARLVKPQDEALMRGLGNEIVGIRQISILQPTGSPRTDVHIAISPLRSSLNFWPTFGREASELNKPSIKLDEAMLLGSAEATTGWNDQPGWPDFYWVRAGGTAVVFATDRRAIAAAIDRWLAKWSRSEFASVRLTGGPDRLLGSTNTVIADTEAHVADVTRPDFLIPVRGRFGTWQIASWDRATSRVEYHVPTLIGSGVLAVALAAIAVAASSGQRRALALAAQRVTFVNRVSHELRAPMTNILLNLDLVAEAVESERKIVGRVALVREEAQRLGRMIENVLTFSRREQDKLQLQPRACTPDRIIEAVLEQFLAGFERRRIMVERSLSVSRACMLDADALAQITANLLSNVEKYAPSSTVTLSTRIEDESLVCTVEDTGAGVPAYLAERIFLPFERADSRVTEGVSGTGLGLSIGRELAQRMGGTLCLLPSARGAAFELRIPAPKASPITSVSAA